MAALGVAAGHNQFNGTYNPEIWSTKLLVKFYNETIFSVISNMKYEGEIKSQGDTVKIRNTPTVAIKDYTKGQTLETEHLQTSVIDLEINKAKYWRFLAEDVDTVQSNIDYVEDWTRDAAKQLNITIDLEILGDIYDAVPGPRADAGPGPRADAGAGRRDDVTRRGRPAVRESDPADSRDDGPGGRLTARRGCGADEAD